MPEKVNSVSWWNEYFQNKWEIMRGKEQTAFFMQLIIDALPQKIKSFINKPGTTILDWGCALGQGVDLLERDFPNAEIIGLDLSDIAIEKAKALYPNYKFTTESLENTNGRYTTIFCSNCLEHFENPIKLIDEHLGFIESLYIILVPYKEENRIESHLVTFDDDFFPEEIGTFCKFYSKIIDTADSEFWHGSQLLVVYCHRTLNLANKFIDDNKKNVLNPASMIRKISGVDVNPTTDSQSSQLWDRVAETYAEEADSAEIELGREIESLLIDIGIKPKASLLEVGCGSGHLSGYLASKGFTTTLMDFSNVAITKAKAYYEKYDLKGNYILCDMMKLSIENVTPHDVVWNSGVFEHFDSWQVIDVLRRMGKVAQKYVIVLVPNARSFPYLLFRRHAMENNEWIWGRELLRESMQHLAEAAGLEVIEEKYLGHHYCQAHLDYVNSELGQEYADVYQQNLIPDNQSYLIALVARPRTDQEIVGYNERIGKILKEEAIVAKKTYYFDFSAITNSLKNLQKKEAELSSALQAKDGRIITLNAEIERMVNDVKSLQDINLNHQKREEELTSTLHAKDVHISELDAEIERIVNDVGSLQGINLNHQKREEELTSTLHAKDVHISELDAEIERIVNDVGSLQDINLNHQKREEELTSALHAKDVHISELDAEIERIVNDVGSLQDINLNHQKREEELTSALHAKDVHISELDAEIERIVNDVGSLQDININHQKREEELTSALQAKDTCISVIEASIVWQLLIKYQKFIETLLPHGTSRRGCYDAWLLLMRRGFTKKKNRLKVNNATINQDTRERTKAVDIICFPIINWDFRYQRPQQLLSRFAKDGYRVFYLTVDPMPLNTKYSVREIQKNIWELMPSISTKFNVYGDTLSKEQIVSFISSIDQVKKDFEIVKALCFVVFPKWEPIVSKLRDIYGWKIIYDCLDEHTGFSNVDNSIVHGEGMLIKRSDLVIATSSHLYNKVNEYRNDALLIPNAGDFEHFSELPQNELLKKIKKPIIGYYGAIAEWFDNDLLEFLATKRKNWNFVLIGHTFGSNIRKLQEFHNVHFLGEKEYSELPKYLYWFDVCIIPFKITPLIEATHPVKFYEYLSSGKPVVSVKLPELLQYHDLCYLADDNEDFLKKIEMALEEEGLETEKRIEFARSNTWNDRYATLATHAEAIFEEADN